MNPINHVAIIMDGNGRWGIKKKKSRNYGHQQGLKTVEKIIIESLKRNIKYLTLFAFSTENWKRPKSEIKFLFSLLEKFLLKKTKESIIGKKSFSKKLNKLLKKSERLTSKNNKLQINLALNYGSKSEIANTFNIIKRKGLKISEKTISRNLYTANMPDPDVLIRTGNTNRLSNFLLWQLAYSEIFFVKKLWPDFNKKDYNRIINSYKKIKRNFGNI